MPNPRMNRPTANTGMVVEAAVMIMPIVMNHAPQNMPTRRPHRSETKAANGEPIRLPLQDGQQNYRTGKVEGLTQSTSMT